MSHHLKNLPTITIITVNFNDDAHLSKTIDSVLSQNYANKEYIIVDGGSSDQSTSLIESYSDSIDKWVSEKDRGIFDAMNKGVSMSNGEYINFMNAGDWFLSDNTLTEIFTQHNYDEADFIYGNHEVHYPNFIKKKSALPQHFLWKHMIFSHQALFVKSEILKKNPFNLDFKIAADFHFIFNSYRKGFSFYHVNKSVAGYLAGGQSESNVIKAYLENKKVVFAHQPTLTIRFFHYGLIAKQLLVVLFRKIIPEKWFLTIMEWKNKIDKN